MTDLNPPIDPDPFALDPLDPSADRGLPTRGPATIRLSVTAIRNPTAGTLDDVSLVNVSHSLLTFAQMPDAELCRVVRQMIRQANRPLL